MAACLYDPDGGFFTTGPLRSVKEGDFLTSPEVSPWFGRMLARFAEREVEGGLFVDVGAGSGSSPALSALTACRCAGRMRIHTFAAMIVPMSAPTCM